MAERLGERLQGRAEILGREHLVYGIERSPRSQGGRTGRLDVSALR